MVDESSLRRGRETANAMFGNAASVLVGDFLYSRAFQMMVSVNRMRVLDVLADATNVIAEGEVLQLMNMHDPDLAVDDYLRVIRFKTAKLFEASARLGAVLGRASHRRSRRPAPTTVARWAPRSSWSTTCWTTKATTTQLGKNVGDDLREGKPTLPLLIAMERGTAAERELIRHAIEHGEVAAPAARSSTIVRRTGALDATRDAARSEATRRAAACACCRRRAAREALLELCVRSVRPLVREPPTPCMRAVAEPRCTSGCSLAW